MVYFLIGAENIYGAGDSTWQKINAEIGSIASIKTKFEVILVFLGENRKQQQQKRKITNERTFQERMFAQMTLAYGMLNNLEII